MRLPILAACALAAARLAGAEDAVPAPLTVQDCLACHADPDLSITLGSGETQSLPVDAGGYARLAPGPCHTCTRAPPGSGAHPHPPVTPASRATFRAAFRDACKTCHLDNDRK